MGSRVSGGLVGGFVVVLLGVTVVFDISDVTGVIVSLVGDGLSASVGKVDVVRAGDVALAVAIASTEFIYTVFSL